MPARDVDAHPVTSGSKPRPAIMWTPSTMTTITLETPIASCKNIFAANNRCKVDVGATTMPTCR